MFQFRRFPAYAYLIQRRLTEYCSAGFPHSEILGLTLMCSSPRLIAACHVLLRLLMPRHSPCALISLTFTRHSHVRHGPENYASSLQKLSTLAPLFYPHQSGFRHSDLFHNFASFALCCLLRILSICIVQFSRYTYFLLKKKVSKENFHLSRLFVRRSLEIFLSLPSFSRKVNR